MIPPQKIFKYIDVTAYELENKLNGLIKNDHIIEIIVPFRPKRKENLLLTVIVITKPSKKLFKNE